MRHSVGDFVGDLGNHGGQGGEPGAEGPQSLSGLDSDVLKSTYTKVRAGTFMGKRMIQDFVRGGTGGGGGGAGCGGGAGGGGAGGGTGAGAGDPWYLTEVAPHEFDSPGIAARLPPEGSLMDGSVFLKRFPDGHRDPVTAVEGGGKYDVAGPARHPAGWVIDNTHSTDI